MRVLQQQRNETNLWINKANNYTQVCRSIQPWVQRLFVFQALVWCWKPECLLLRFKDFEHDLFILGNWRLFSANVSFSVIPFATADSFLLWPLASQWVWGAEAALAWRVENKALSPPDTHTYTADKHWKDKYYRQERNFTAGHLKAHTQKKVRCVKDGGSTRGAKTSACHWCDERTLWGWMSFICAKPSWQPRTWIRKYSETAAAPVSCKNHESWGKISPVCSPISSDKCIITEPLNITASVSLLCPKITFFPGAVYL